MVEWLSSLVNNFTVVQSRPESDGAMAKEMDAEKTPWQIGVQLFTVSFISLFLELMIIRWVPANIRLIAYYANLMLISSFLGIGLGALMKGRNWRLFRLFPFILLIDLIVILLCRPYSIPGGTLEFRFYSVPGQLSGYAVVMSIFVLNTVVFVPLGEKIGQLFDRLPPLYAYSWDLGGSLAGTIIFGCFSFLFFSPFWGLVLVSVLYVLALGRRFDWKVLITFGMCLACLNIYSEKEAIWSPYYYVTITDEATNRRISLLNVPDQLQTMKDPPRYGVRVNQDFYQRHATVDYNRYTEGSDKYYETMHEYFGTTFPYQIKPSPDRVLVVGSGGGRDVEAAILSNSSHVDAVEIDPVLVEISRSFNASRIYFNPRVNVEINDARAFFTNAEKGYDVIVFGLLDSQALFSSMSNIRLDGFVHTVESYRTAFNLLNDQGVMALSFAAGTDWLVEKLIMMLSEATGRAPLVYAKNGQVFKQGGTVLMVVPKEAITPPAQYGMFKQVNYSILFPQDPTISLATDDWPFLYLKKKAVPQDYIVVIGVLLVISFLVILKAGKMRWGRRQVHFFFLGAGFLLLETKSITDCSLYFGGTWFVTMLVVAGILLMVLIANHISLKLKSFRLSFYLPLILSMVLLYVVPEDFILKLSFPGRLLWVLIFVPLPVLFAGLIFSTTFRDSAHASQCFGSNLIGATIGGFTEYLGIVIGFQNLSLLVIVAYLASLLIMMIIQRK